MLDFDFEAQVQAARFIREVFNTEPLGDTAGSETTPGLSAVPADADDEAWADFIKGKCKCIPRFA